MKRKSAEEDTSSREKERQLKHERRAEHKTTNLLLFHIIMLSYHVSNMLLFLFLTEKLPTHREWIKTKTNWKMENWSDLKLYQRNKKTQSHTLNFKLSRNK